MSNPVRVASGRLARLLRADHQHLLGMRIGEAQLEGYQIPANTEIR